MQMMLDLIDAERHPRGLVARSTGRGAGAGAGQHGCDHGGSREAYLHGVTMRRRRERLQKAALNRSGRTGDDTLTTVNADVG